MRIISKFVDYYDGAQGHGFDPTLIYERKPKGLLSGMDVAPDIVHCSLYRMAYEEALRGWFDPNPGRIFHIGFAGKLYTGRMVVDKSGHLIFDYQKPEKNPRPWEKFVWHEGEDAEDRFFELNAPVFIEAHKCGGQINPCLGDFQFYKVIDAYTAYQELAMFLGGVLGNKEKDLIILSDEDKAAKHGFDEWSFKNTPPGAKKQRRKQNKKTKRGENLKKQRPLL